MNAARSGRVTAIEAPSPTAPSRERYTLDIDGEDCARITAVLRDSVEAHTLTELLTLASSETRRREQMLIDTFGAHPASDKLYTLEIDIVDCELVIGALRHSRSMRKISRPMRNVLREISESGGESNSAAALDRLTEVMLQREDRAEHRLLRLFEQALGN